jgi:hypothetical protein
MRTFVVRLAVAAFAATLLACGSAVKVAPDGSMTGTMTPGQLPEVTIDGKPMRLSPGARIYNQSNLTITPNQLPANSRVRYKTDATGLVSQVWVLPAER